MIGCYLDRYGQSGESTLNIYYVAQILSGEMYPKSETREVRWFDVELPPSHFAFNHAQLVLRDWRKSNGNGNIKSK